MKQKDFNSNILLRVRKNAREVRMCSDYKFFRIGAVFFNNKKILVSAANVNKTNPLQGEYNKYRSFDPRYARGCMHAEINALVKLKRLYPNINPEDIAIMVYRETQDGKYAMAKPCPACEKALRDFGIRHVYYSGKESLCYEHYED